MKPTDIPPKIVKEDGRTYAEVEIGLDYGICARPAAMIVKYCVKQDREIAIEKDGNEVSARSIMGLLTLGAHQGARLTVEVEGTDAEAERIVRDLHRGLSSEDSFALDLPWS